MAGKNSEFTTEPWNRNHIDGLGQYTPLRSNNFELYLVCHNGSFYWAIDFAL